MVFAALLGIDDERKKQNASVYVDKIEKVLQEGVKRDLDVVVSVVDDLLANMPNDDIFDPQLVKAEIELRMPALRGLLQQRQQQQQLQQH